MATVLNERRQILFWFNRIRTDQVTDVQYVTFLLFNYFPVRTAIDIMFDIIPVLFCPFMLL